MAEYKEKFDITEHTIFALYPNIYTDDKLTPDLIIHEKTHLKQQEERGVNEWVKEYIEDPQKRLEYEIEAYKNQLEYFKDRNQRHRMRMYISKVLSSSLYGNIINYEEAYKLF